MGFSYMGINNVNFFDVKKYEHCFKTEPNEAYFWHGQTSAMGMGVRDGKFTEISFGGQENAAMIASENGGKTLEMCMHDHRDELEAAGVSFNDETGEIRYGDNDIENNAFWKGCSKSFAAQASGDIHVIDGQDPRLTYHENNLVAATPEEDFKKNIWNSTEHPVLEENSKVESITHIDAMTGKETGQVETFDRTNDYYNGMGY